MEQCGYEIRKRCLVGSIGCVGLMIIGVIIMMKSGKVAGGDGCGALMGLSFFLGAGYNFIMLMRVVITGTWPKSKEQNY